MFKDKRVFAVDNAAELLEQLMESRGSNAYRLGEEIDTHPNTIYNWTKYGAQPSYASVVKCAKALGYRIEIVDTVGG